ncbi:hypothetical protein KXV85_002587, partial [Aspergillus fumigatus]
PVAQTPGDKGADQTAKKEPAKQICEVPQPAPAPKTEDLARDAVIADLTRKIAANANDTLSRYKRGQVYAVKRAYALAMQDFDTVISRTPQDAEALNNRCWTRAATGDLQGALADCNQALRIDPGLSDALDSRGLVNLKLGRHAEAIKDYTDAIQRNPRSSSSLFGLAGSLILGFLDLQSSQAQNRFYTDLEDWLASTVREYGGDDAAGA